jgi:hypothetical protein
MMGRVVFGLPVTEQVKIRQLIETGLQFGGLSGH